MGDRRSEIGDRSWKIGGRTSVVGASVRRCDSKHTGCQALLVIVILCVLCVSVVRHIGDGRSEIGVRGNDDITWSRALRVPLRSSANRPTPIPDLRSPISERLEPATHRRSGARSPIFDLPYPILGFPHSACPLPLRRPCFPLRSLCLCGSFGDGDCHRGGIHHRDAECTEKT